MLCEFLYRLKTTLNLFILHPGCTIDDMRLQNSNEHIGHFTSSF